MRVIMALSGGMDSTALLLRILARGEHCDLYLIQLRSEAYSRA